jgi:polysaccharide biosynthesis transport protein
MTDRLLPERGRLTSGESPAGLPAHPSARGEAQRLWAQRDTDGDWRRYWSAVMRYRWWVLLAALLGLGVGAGAGRSQKPRYLVQATIWVQEANRPARDRGPIRSEQLLQSGAWVELLRSYHVLDDVVRGRRLYLRYVTATDSVMFAGFDLEERFRPGKYELAVDGAGREFTLSTQGGVLVQKGVLGEAVGKAVGFRWVPTAAQLRAGRTIAFAVANPRDVAKRLADSVTPRMDPAGTFLRLTLISTDPQGAAATLNAVTHRYVAVAAELQRAKLTELSRILDEQLRSAEQNMRAAEFALQSFRVKTITLPQEPSTPVAPGLESTQDPVFRGFFDMKIEREQLRRDRQAIERALSRGLSAGGALGALEVVESVQRSSELTGALRELTTKQAELRSLRYRYTDAHPPVQRLAVDIGALEQETLPALARALIADIAARERELESRVESASVELRQIPPRAIEEARLRRDVTVAQNLYTGLQERYGEARLAEASSIPDVQILDPAVAPQEPFRNVAVRLMLLGFLGGLGLAAVGVVLIDRIDPRVRYPEQITHEMGLPILGALPQVKGRGTRVGAEEANQAIEAFRGIRMNLVYAHGAAGPLMFTITSPGAGDGKSFLSCNLALSFVDAGYRTILIDGDVRRGALHRMFGAARRPGLTDFLAGTTSWESIIQQTRYPSLYFIGAGTRKQGAPELLGSPAMLQLLTTLRSSFTAIVVDSPPLGAGVDPFVLGAATGNLLLVLRAGTTDRELAKAKLEMLDRLPVRVLGAVMNDVSSEGAYRYYGYLPSYAAEQEDADVSRPARPLGGTS